MYLQKDVEQKGSWFLVQPTSSVQEEVPDPRGLDPGDVGGGAGEDAGFVLHSAANGAEAHHAVHLPAVLTQLAQQRTAGVPLKEGERWGGSPAGTHWLQVS